MEFNPNEHVKVDGGFVKKEAKEALTESEAWAKHRNSFLSRSFVDIVMGKNKKTPTELLQIDANAEDRQRAPQYSSSLKSLDDKDREFDYENSNALSWDDNFYSGPLSDFIDEFTPEATSSQLADALEIMRDDFSEEQIADIEKEIEKRKIHENSIR